MFLDPFYLVFMLPALALSLWASWRTHAAFKKYSRVRTARGLTGAQAAQEMLRGAGITDVQVVPTRGRSFGTTSFTLKRPTSFGCLPRTTADGLVTGSPATCKGEVPGHWTVSYGHETVR